MSNIRERRKNLEKIKKQTKAGSTALANAFHTPDRYGTEEQKEKIKELEK